MTEEAKEGRNAFLEKRKPNLKEMVAIKISV
jgi:1,4-dihydroxy-2-naphthoyl-CoA synthase